MDTTARPSPAGAATAVRDALVGRVVDGRYLIESRIARGGMATVYLALDRRLDRLVALKIMHAGLAEDQAFVDRFQREAKAAARLTHPHVVSVYDQGDSEGLVYLAMEYVPGRTVRDVLREHGRLSPEQALTILDPVLQALVAAHRAGFVHRDIKPENVLLGDDGSVKVADFGLARAISTSTSTATQGVLIGTVAYLSPEQVEHGVADGRSDVYGCGILLYEMLTGAVPYAGETPLAVAYQHVNAAVPRPSSIQPGTPAQVDDLVLRATRHEPDARWHDAAEFLTAVRSARAALPQARPLTVDLSDGARTLVVNLPTDQQGSSRRPAAGGGAPASKPPRPAKTRRRRGGLIVLLGIVLAAALVGAAGWWYGSARSVPVPAVVGKTLTAAQTAYAGSDLTIKAGDKAYSETVPKDRIITTDPPPGGQAPAGSVVTATISLGPERYPVPDVSNQPVADARTMITDGSLAVADTVQRQYDPTVAKGSVIATTPKTGQQLRKGTPVTLVVSRGPEPVPVPRVVGVPLARAQSMLTKAGLEYTQTAAYNMKVAKGSVVSVTPAAGNKLTRGDTVTLVVSNGPPPVDVPSVLGQSESAAVTNLQALGLTVDRQYVFGGILKRVVRQSAVGPGALHKGDTIVLTIT